MRLPFSVLVAATTMLASYGAPSSTISKCEKLANVNLAHTSIRAAELVSAGAFKLPDGKPLPDLPAFCRVAGVIKPSTDSNIQFEVWMPASGWNGKYFGVGNGGFAGQISFGGMGAALARGYATASTDTGHEAGGTDAGWALGHPEKIIDFGYRAIHETAEDAKTLIHAFYDKPSRRSYFESCSNGGRQALMEAQRYPGDYDGIIAGAPANNWSGLLTNAVADLQATLSDPASYIPAAKLAAIQAAAVASCDTLDGVKDGMLQDPAQCHFDPSPLLCSGAESNTCLTQPQLTALKAIYAGLRNDGEVVFPGYSPGGEAEPGGWGLWITGTAPEKSLMFAFGTQYFKNMVYDDPAWDFRKFDVMSGLEAARKTTARALDATDADLSKFKERGGKLILYHGWSDAAIPAMSTIDYYDAVVSKLGHADADGFVRLFMVPGMQHCGGGSGPNSFGPLSPHADPVHDVGAALEHWVEDGVAPVKIVATKYKSGADSTSGVLRTRPLCPYPQVAVWDGKGSIDDAGSFTCADEGSPHKPTGRPTGSPVQ